MKLTTKGLKIKFFIAGISLLKGSLFQGFHVLPTGGSITYGVKNGYY
jgi:hypothetical protein